jgi:hypothetical protein
MGGITLSVATRAAADSRNPVDPRLAITTDRLSYRLSKSGAIYVGTVIVTLSNPTRDTVYLASRCGFGAVPYHQFAPIDGTQLFLTPGWNEVCALTAPSAPVEPLHFAMAIPPDAARRDTIRFRADPFVRRGEQVARDGIARFQLRYTPFVRRGFLHKRWTTDSHVYVSSDPFELITPGAER